MTSTIPRAIKLFAVVLALCFATVSMQAQDWAKARLDASSRHHEYVALHPTGRTVQTFVVYPEVKDKAPVIVMIHEIFGLTDWAKEMADELAGQGYIVVAPDLLTGFGPNGGGKSFTFAAHRKDLSAAFVFYGTPPSDVTPITAPIYGFYAGNDARITATVPATVAAMTAAGKKYDPVTYDGAGHGFMRAGEDPTNTVPGNKTAREQGFSRLVTLLKAMN